LLFILVFKFCFFITLLCTAYTAVAEMALERAWDGADAVYLSYDIDSLEAAFVPGTGWPEPGGRDGTSHHVIFGDGTSHHVILQPKRGSIDDSQVYSPYN
jgi:hypothetical protein